MLFLHLTLSSSAAFLRALSAFLFLIVAARYLSLGGFGEFMFAFTVVNILGLFIDYGQQIGVLKELSENKSSSSLVVSRALWAKLSLLVVVAGGFFLLFLAYPPLRAFVGFSLLLFSGYALNSFSLLFLLPSRARSDHKPDLFVAAVDAVLLAVCVVAAVLLDAGEAGLALAFLAAKLGALTAAGLLFSKKDRIHLVSPGTVAAGLREGVPFALHMIIGMLYINIDVIVIQGLVPADDYSVYQAGLRLVLGFGFVLTVVNNVFMSRWALHLENSRATLERELHRYLSLSLLGGIGGIPLVHILSPTIVIAVFGDDFLRLAPLLWMFGVVIVLRLMGAFTGLVLTLGGQQIARLVLGIFSLVAIIIANMTLAPRYGILATAVILVIVHVVFLLVSYVIAFKTVLNRKAK